MSTSNTQMPGADPMGDTLGFMKNLWAGVKMPGMTMPSLSVDEINKQIADLKTVESWLGLNMSMLRASIQALEVQSATISALQSMGQTVGESMGSMEKAMGAAMGAAGSMASFNPLNAATPMGATGADAGAGSGAPGSSMPADTEATSGTNDGPSNPFSFAAPTADKPPAPTAEAGAESAMQDGNAADLAAAAAPFVNPAAWWGMLQDQFKQAVGQALEPEAKPFPMKRKSAAKASSQVRKAGNGSVGKSNRTGSKSAASASKAKRSATVAKRAPTSKANGGAGRTKSAAAKGGAAKARSSGAASKVAAGRKRG